MKKTVLKENNSCRMQCIAEENLEQEMDSQVEPFLKQVQICGWMEVAPEGGESQERDVASADSTSQRPENAPEDGVAQRKTAKTGGLYYELYPQETQKGTIVISYGFTESCLKYHELIYYFICRDIRWRLWITEGMENPCVKWKITQLYTLDCFPDM